MSPAICSSRNHTDSNGSRALERSLALAAVGRIDKDDPFFRRCVDSDHAISLREPSFVYRRRRRGRQRRRFSPKRACVTIRSERRSNRQTQLLP